MRSSMSITVNPNLQSNNEKAQLALLQNDTSNSLFKINKLIGVEKSSSVMRSGTIEQRPNILSIQPNVNNLDIDQEGRGTPFFNFRTFHKTSTYDFISPKIQNLKNLEYSIDVEDIDEETLNKNRPKEKKPLSKDNILKYLSSSSNENNSFLKNKLDKSEDIMPLEAHSIFKKV